MAKILVIDDEPLARKFVRDVLVAAGHAVSEACEGITGLATLQAQVPDLIVCDLYMPGMEGVETIRHFHRLVPAVPIVAVSGGGRWLLLTPLEEVAALGAAVALSKPFSRNVLLEVVNKLLVGPLRTDSYCPDEARRAEDCGRLCPRLEFCSDAGSSVLCGVSRKLSLPLNDIERIP